jgi:retinol-binding protein 3
MNRNFRVASIRRVAAALSLGLVPALAGAQTSGQIPRVDAVSRAAIIEAIAADIDTIYVFPDVAAQMIDYLRGRQKGGAYDGLGDVVSFTDRLTSDLQSISHDRHLNVRPMPPEEGGPGHEVDTDHIDRTARERWRRSNYGFAKVERLPGNVGYLDLREFVDADAGGRTAVAAMGMLAGSDAVILDLRQNGGGAPSMVQLISSYFFAEPVHLNSFYVRRGDRTDQFWSQAYVDGPRMVDTPLYILTSGYTFSAAEEFTYNMRNLERATIVGETTGGGAHPVDMMRYPELGVRMSLPFGRAVNPITGTNWEGTGVEPHLQVPAPDALQVAYTKALETVRAAAGPEEAGEIDWVLEGLEAEPVDLSVEELGAYAGQYGPRSVRLEGGGLVYQRGDAMPHELIAVGEDRFHLADDDSFRIRFERDASGGVVALVGCYDDGREEPSPRSNG